MCFFTGLKTLTTSVKDRVVRLNERFSVLSGWTLRRSLALCPVCFFTLSALTSIFFATICFIISHDIEFLTCSSVSLPDMADIWGFNKAKLAFFNNRNNISGGLIVSVDISVVLQGCWFRKVFFPLTDLGCVELLLQMCLKIFQAVSRTLSKSVDKVSVLVYVE